MQRCFSLVSQVEQVWQRSVEPRGGLTIMQVDYAISESHETQLLVRNAERDY